MLAPDVFRRLRETSTPERDRRIDWEAAKTRILSILRQRAERGEKGLSNEEIRRIAHLDRNQAGRLMGELLREVPQVQMVGARNWPTGSGLGVWGSLAFDNGSLVERTRFQRDQAASFWGGGLLNALDFAEPMNAPGSHAEPLTGQPIRHPFAAQPPDLLPEFCGPCLNTDLADCWDGA